MGIFAGTICHGIWTFPMCFAFLKLLTMNWDLRGKVNSFKYYILHEAHTTER